MISGAAWRLTITATSPSSSTASTAPQATCAPSCRRASAADAADARLHEGAQVAWGAVLAVEDDGDVAVIVNRHAAPDIICCCHNYLKRACCLPSRPGQRNVKYSVPNR